jgi:hypothetical protein
MSTIYLDPVAMDATAGAIGEQARGAAAAVESLETACWAQVPPALEGWLAEELHDIALNARMAALLYVVSALDTTLRAQQIQADQSLAAAVLAPASTSPVFGPTLMGGFSALASTANPTVADLTGGPAVVGGYFLGASPGPGAVSMPGLTTDAFLANNPLLGAANNLQATNPAAAAQLLGLHGLISDSNATMVGVRTNGGPGASYIGNGLYRGHDGSIGTIANVYRDPKRPGELLVD